MMHNNLQHSLLLLYRNFAREIMQLFSIGLYRLHSNGTRVTDDDGVELQTYTTPDIENFAKVWTGVSYDTCVMMLLLH